MESAPVVIDIGKPSSEKISISGSASPKVTAALGEGVELLMNDKRKNASEHKEKDTTIKNIASLEEELNELSSKTAPSVSLKKGDAMKLVIGNDSQAASIKTVNSELGESAPKVSLVGKETAGIKVEKSPFGSLMNVPINPDKVVPEISKEEMLKEKFTLLRKFDTLERRGVQLTKKYNMDSDLKEMKGEYEMIVAEKEKTNSVKFQGKMLMAAITGLEFLNTKFDQFDVQLDGWAEQMNENLSDYDEIFAELHEKYRSKAKMAPELKLLFQLSGSAIMVHMTNTMFKSSMPGMDDIMRQNPELMQQFTKAAVNTMGDERPGFSSFMSDVMGSSSAPEPNADTIHGAPPAPIRTKASDRDAPASRPDMTAARSDTRAEMRGPSDIESLLDGLKRKVSPATPIKVDDSSTVSIKDLKDMADAKVPTRGKKSSRPKKSTISLDI